MSCEVVKGMSCFALECPLGRGNCGKALLIKQCKMEVESARSIEMESTSTKSLSDRVVKRGPRGGGSLLFPNVP